MTEKNVFKRKTNRFSEFRINRSESRSYPILSVIRRILPFYLAETVLSTHAIYLQLISERESRVFHLTRFDMIFRAKKVLNLREKTVESCECELR